MFLSRSLLLLWVFFHKMLHPNLKKLYIPLSGVCFLDYCFLILSIYSWGSLPGRENIKEWKLKVCFESEIGIYCNVFPSLSWFLLLLSIVKQGKHAGNCTTCPQVCDENLQSHKRHQAQESTVDSSTGFYFLNQKTRIFSWRTGPSILILPVFPSGNCSTCFSFSAPYCLVLSTWIYTKPWLHPQCCHLGHSPLGLAPQLSPTSQPQTTPATLHRAAKAQIWVSLSSATNPSVAPRMTFNIPSQSRPSFPDVTPSSSHAKLSLELQTFLGPWASLPASPLPRTLLTSTLS